MGSSVGNDGFDGLWAGVLEDPKDEKRHKPFITYAVETERYLDAIDRYKALRSQTENKEVIEIIDQQLKRLSTLATTKLIGSLQVTRKPPLGRNAKFLWAFGIAVGLSSFVFPPDYTVHRATFLAISATCFVIAYALGLRGRS